MLTITAEVFKKAKKNKQYYKVRKSSVTGNKFEIIILSDCLENAIYEALKVGNNPNWTWINKGEI